MIKDILIMCIVSLFGTLFAAFVCLYRGIVISGKLKLCKETFPEEYVPMNKNLFYVLLAVCFAMGILVQYFLYKNTDIAGRIKLTELYFIVAAAAVVDGKRKIIPNLLIIIGFAARAGMYVYEYFTSEDFFGMVKSDLIGFALGFIFLFIVSLVSHGSIGMGDAKLFGVIGITCGAFGTYSTLFASLIISVVVSLTLMALKKIGKKDSIPFGPFIAFGYIITVLLTSY